MVFSTALVAGLLLFAGCQKKEVIEVNDGETTAIQEPENEIEEVIDLEEILVVDVPEVTDDATTGGEGFIGATTGDDFMFDGATTGGDSEAIDIDVIEDEEAASTSSVSSVPPAFFLTSEISPAYAAEGKGKLPPMADMESQFTKFSAKLDRDLDDLSMGGDFDDAAGNLRRDANVLLLLAIAIGRSDESGTLKPAAPALLREAKALLEAADAKTAAEAVKAIQNIVAAPEASEGEVDWENTVQLAPLMAKVVPSLTTEIKRLSKNEKTLLRSRNAKNVAGNAAALAVVAAGSRLSVAETNAPDQEALWKECCDEFCVLSLNVNEAAHAMGNGGAFDDYTVALQELEETCNTCHEKFSVVQ